MSGDLLLIDIETLLQQTNLEESQFMLRRMRREVDKKREELRVTVGNRYRDLIDAADTIGEMKKTSEDVLNHLVTMENLLSSLKHRQLLGFQNEHLSPAKQKDALEAKKVYRSIAAQVRLLMELPEIMWKMLESGDYCSAAQVQQLGFHVHMGLSVECCNGIDVQNWFPVIKRQHVALQSFNDMIVKESTKELKSVQLDLQKACDSGCALIFQDCGNSLKMLTKFLELRTEAVRSVSMSQGTGKQQLVNFLECVTSSLVALHALFVEGISESELPCGMLSNKLRTHCQPNSISTIHLIQLSSGSLVKHLPPIISEFRPSLKEAWQPLSIAVIRQECQKWFDTACHWVSSEFARLLDCVTQIKTLANFRDTAYLTIQKATYASQWSELTRRLLGSPTVCLWERLLRRPILAKIEKLIQLHLDSAVDSMKHSILQASGKFALKTWLWTEAANDIQQAALSTPNSSGIYMKTRCYTPIVQQLCAQWDQKCTQLWEDLLPYQESKIEQADRTALAFDLHESRGQVFAEMDRRCVDSVKKLVSLLNDQVVVADDGVIFASKLSSALADLCPRMRNCINQNQVTDSPSWISLAEFLRTSSLSMFQVWMQQVLVTFSQDLGSRLNMSTLVATVNSTPMWDEITIEEESETGDTVQSKIRVPMNPTFPLQQGLFEICQNINQIGPHAISKKAQLLLMENIGCVVLDIYQDYLDKYPGKLAQGIALQLLFDVRFIVGLFVTRDNKIIQERIKVVCDILEGHIDPFDLDVFNPYLQRNVKRAVQRLQFIFGPLITCDRHAILWAARVATTVSSSQLEIPSVAAMVSSSPRFLLLPLSTNTRIIESDLVTNKKTNGVVTESAVVTTQKKVKSKADLSATTAAAAVARSGVAFFGAMSSGWSSSIFGSDK